MSDGDIGHGSTLVGGTTGTVGNVQRIGVTGRSREMVDISTMDSTDKFREFKAGMADEGEITAEVNFDVTASTIATALNNAFQAATSETWTITFPGAGKTFACTGVISSLDIDDPFDGKVAVTLSIKLTGKATWT